MFGGTKAEPSLTVGLLPSYLRVPTNLPSDVELP
jgi:hypothetical protein